MAKRFTIESVFKAVDRFSAPVARMQSKIGAFTSSAERGLKSVDRVNSKISGGLKKAAFAFGAVAGAAGLAAKTVISSGADFEQSITNVGAVMLKSRDQIADLEAEAKRLGATTKFTAGEVAGGMEIMARAGFESTEILAGMNGVLAATAAEGGEIAPVMEVIAATMKGMGLQASETGRVADVLALASARTKSSITSLGESMKNLAPVARQFNISLEESVGMAALLQDVGMDASEAGTSISTMLTKLTKPSDAVAGKLRKMGVAFKDANGNMKPANVLFAEMTKALEKTGGNAEQVALFADLVGLRGQKAALNLAEMAKTGRLSSLIEELDNAAGSAQKMADIRLDTTLGDWDLFKSAVDGVYQELFATQNGPLRGVIQSMTEWVGKNGELIATGIAEFLQTIVDNLDDIVKWGKRIAKVVTVFYAITTGVKVLTAAITIMNLVMAMNPIGLIVLAVGAAIAMIWVFWDEIEAWFSKLFSSSTSLAEKFEMVFRLIMPIPFLMYDGFMWALDAIMNNWGAISEFFSGLWEGIKNTFISVITFIAQKLIDFISGPARLAIMAAEKVGILQEGTSARITEALTINSPQERTANSITETRSTTEAEVTVRSPGMKSEVTKKPARGSGLRVQASGAM